MIYFTLSKYKETYDFNMSNYLLNNEDFDEIDFIKSEIENYNINLKIMSSNPKLAFNEFTNPLTNDYKDDISLKNFIEDNYLSIGSSIFREHKEQYIEIKKEVLKDNTSSKISSLKNIFFKIIEFLEMKKNENEMTENKKNNISIETLKWQGTQLEFTELFKAVILSNKLNADLSDIEIFKRLKIFFNVKDFNHYDKLKDIGKRSKTTTPLLNTLEISLNNWIVRKD